jgi:predicted flap endonuclease-1-like 5' DNA nuclease
MKVEDIEGIGPAYQAKLYEAGITTVEQLLDTCAGPKGRKELAAKTGITETLILKWTNHADLIRVNGIGPQFAELLEAAGVDTVKELRNRNAENLAAKIKEVNDAKNLTGSLPSASMVQGWIDHAKQLEPKVTH